MALSLQRIGLSLLIALLIGVPLGICIGLSQWFNKLTGTLFQFLRMVSPLSWMPLAVMALGVGESPVVFLLSFAAVWPIMLNTATGWQRWTSTGCSWPPACLPRAGSW